MIDVLGNPIGTVTTSLLNNVLAVVAAVLCTTTQIEILWSQPMKIVSVKLMAKSGTPTGKLFIVQGPSSSNIKIVQNFDMTFLDTGSGNTMRFKPNMPHMIDVGLVSADASTTRITIKGHTLAAAVPYQIVFETEEYS
jgi:hypothetical protein